MEREKLNEKCRLLAMEIDNTREAYDRKRWVVNCLLKEYEYETGTNVTRTAV